MITRNLIKVLLLVSMLALGCGATYAQGDSYDQQQWWNPGDWFDDTPNNNWNSTWDYDYSWDDNDWYDYGYTDTGYGLDWNDNDYYDYGTDDDVGIDSWYDNYDYDYDYDYDYGT